MSGKKGATQMKRNRKRVPDTNIRQSRSGHGDPNKGSNDNRLLYTPPIHERAQQVSPHVVMVDNGHGAADNGPLLNKLEKITNEINSMQHNNSHDKSPRFQNHSYHEKYSHNNAPYFQMPSQLGAPPGHPVPSYSYSSPRPVEYVVGNAPPFEFNSDNRENNNHEQDIGSPQNIISHNQPTKYLDVLHSQNGLQDKSYAESSEISLNVKSLQASLAEAHEEYKRAMNRIQIESKERRSLEQQNYSLNTKIIEARQAVKNTQVALQSAQFATEQLQSQKGQREAYIKELSETINSNISRIATLEGRLKEASEGLLEGSNRRDSFIHQLQAQLARCQEELSNAQNDTSQIHSEKCHVEAELENMRQRLELSEQKLKDSENAVELTFKAKIKILEDKNQSLIDKITGQEHIHQQVESLQEQLGQKSTMLRRAQENGRTLEKSLLETEAKLRNKESIINDMNEGKQVSSLQIQQLEDELKKEKQVSSQCRILEAQLGSKNSEIKILRQSLNDKDAALQSAESSIDNLSREINDKNIEILDIDQKLQNAINNGAIEKETNQIISSMKTEMNDLEHMLQTERTARKSVEAEKETLETKYAALETSVKEKMQLLSEREAEISSLHRSMGTDHVKASRANTLEAKNQELSHSLSVEVQAGRIAKRELEKKELRIETLENQLQGKEKRIQDLESEIKSQSISEVSDRIMTSTVHQLERQLEERDEMLSARNEKVASLERSLQESVGRIRELEVKIRDKSSETQTLIYEKQNALRSVEKQKSSVQSLENNLASLEKQNEALETRAKKLMIENRESSNKIELLEKMVHDMSEAVVDDEEGKSNARKSDMESSFQPEEKYKEMISILHNALQRNDIPRVKKIVSDAFASLFPEANAIPRIGGGIKSDASIALEKLDSFDVNHQSSPSPMPKTLSRHNSRVQSQRQLKPAMSFASDISEADDLSLTLQNLQGNMILGKRHNATSSLAEITDFINSTTKDIEKLSTKKKEMKEAIEKFTVDFKKTHSRLPTTEEKAAASGNIFSNYQQLSHILKKKTAFLADAEEQFQAKQQEMLGK